MGVEHLCRVDSSVRTAVGLAWQRLLCHMLEGCSARAQEGVLLLGAVWVDTSAVANCSLQCVQEPRATALGSAWLAQQGQRNQVHRAMLLLTHTRQLALSPIGCPLAGTRVFVTR